MEIRLPMDGGLYLEDLRVGQRFESATLVVTADASILGCLYLARLPGRVDSRQRIDHGPCRYSSASTLNYDMDVTGNVVRAAASHRFQGSSRALTA